MLSELGIQPISYVTRGGQSQLRSSSIDYIAKIHDLQAQVESSSALVNEVQALKTEQQQKNIQHSKEVRELQAEIAAKPAKGADWQVAEEVEKTLRFQLDALRITEEELAKK